MSDTLANCHESVYTGKVRPINDIRYLLMPVKIHSMHLYGFKEPWQSTYHWQLMHDKCAKELTNTNSQDYINYIVGKEVNNARAVCTKCNLEFDPTLARSERKALTEFVSQATLKMKLLGKNPAAPESAV